MSGQKEFGFDKGSGSGQKKKSKVSSRFHFPQEKDLSAIMKLSDLSEEWYNSKFFSQQERMLKVLEEFRQKEKWSEQNVNKFVLDRNPYKEEYTLLVEVKQKQQHPVFFAEFIFQKEFLIEEVNSLLRKEDLPVITNIRALKN